jgi:hypothetical protein
MTASALAFSLNVTASSCGASSSPRKTAVQGVVEIVWVTYRYRVVAVVEGVIVQVIAVCVVAAAHPIRSFLVNSAGLQFVNIMNEHNEAHQSGCAHESTDLLPSCEGNDLQAGKGRSLQDDEEKEIVQGDRRRLGGLTPFSFLGRNLLAYVSFDMS